MSGTDKARQRCIHCEPAAQDAIRERARAAGKSVSRHVMDLALADAPDRHRLVLSEVEQRALLDDVAEVAALARALRRALPGWDALSVLDAMDLLARQWRR